MARRSYHQFCGLAAALDVVGQRWSLLIVRDLAPGARRFSDLFEGLPGISTDMLTDRLRELEEAGAVTQRQLRSPARAKVYELTARGRELAILAGELAAWGMPLLGSPDDESRANARWMLQSAAHRYVGGSSDGVVHFLIDGREELTLDIETDRARTRYGWHGRADLSVDVSTAQLLQARRDPAALSGLPNSSYQGELRVLAEFFDVLGPIASASHSETASPREPAER